MMYRDGNMGVWGYILMGVSFVLFWGAVITDLRCGRRYGPRWVPGREPVPLLYH